MRPFILIALFATILFSCNRRYYCHCEAEVTVDDVTTIHKYKQSVTTFPRKRAENICQEYARDTQYSVITCALYDR